MSGESKRLKVKKSKSD